MAGALFRTVKFGLRDAFRYRLALEAVGVSSNANATRASFLAETIFTEQTGEPGWRDAGSD